MMTNGEHDRLWMAAFESVPQMEKAIANVQNSLKRANGITIAKELFSIGEMSKETYKDTLITIAKSEGFVVK